MSVRIQLPAPYSDAPFSVSDAVASGLSRTRLRGFDLKRPIRGVRTASELTSRREFVLAAATRLRPWQAIAGSSAAALWGLPLPPELDRRSAPVIVAAPKGRSVPEAAAFRGLRIEPGRLGITQLDGVRITDPITTWCLLARELGLPDLIAAADVLITESTRTSRRSTPTPIGDLAGAVANWSRSPGGGIMRQALGRARMGVDSPMESLLRTLIVDGGLPEPTVHPTVVLLDGTERQPDLGYEDLKLGLEYEGLDHADPKRMRIDITRIEDFAAVGWDTMRVTKPDMAPEPGPLIRKIAIRMRRLGADL